LSVTADLNMKTASRLANGHGSLHNGSEIEGMRTGIIGSDFNCIACSRTKVWERDEVARVK